MVFLEKGLNRGKLISIERHRPYFENFVSIWGGVLTGEGAKQREGI